MSKISLKAQERKIFGRKVKQLRKIGKVPGNVFGPKTKSKALSIEKKELLEVFGKAGETTLVDLTIEGEKSSRPVLITNIQKDPVSSKVLHVDFHQVDLTVKTTANIPIEISGEAPAVAKGGILVALLNEIEVEALPADLPEKFLVDITGLNEIGDTIHVKDLKIDRSKVEIKAEEEEPITTIQEPVKEEEPVPVVAEEGDEEGAEAETEKPAEGEEAKPAEGDKPAEGGKPEETPKSEEPKKKE